MLNDHSFSTGEARPVKSLDHGRRLGAPALCCLLMVGTLLTVSAEPLLGQDCPASALARPKGNSAYLYFPTVDDATYPEHGTFGVATSPLADFDVADLDSGIGTTAQLRQRIFEIVTDDYCEFNVEVIMTTTMPTPTEARWQILGIGSDGNGVGLFGEAQDVDTGDSDPQDYARVWADAFGEQFGGAGGALAGTNSTLERWATAIGHTTSHEAGHNYGVSHGNSAPRTGTVEDQQTNHVMATGSSGLTGEIRAGRRRHFSDTSYEIMGHNIGLNLKTLHNWDFVNPNDVDAHSLELTVLSEATSLSIDWFYNGNRSPWTSPTVASTGGTQAFQGTTYNVFTVTFSTAKSWNNGADGVAPPGVEFHVGATFAESDAVIVYETLLRDSGGTALGLHPRIIGFNAGAADLANGDFAMAVFNPDPDAGDLEVRNFRIQFLPRVADIRTMIQGDTLADLRGLPVVPVQLSRSYEPTGSFDLSDQRTIRIARLTDPRHVDIVADSTGCQRGIVRVEGPGDVDGGELNYCAHGNFLSLFPATTVYVTATVVDPNARHFDPDVGDFVTGPVETHVFYQFAGIVPDFNGNGIDDLLDIRDGTSVDENQNGVPDEAEPEDGRPLPWWLLLLIILILLILIIVWLLRR